MGNDGLLKFDCPLLLLGAAPVAPAALVAARARDWPLVAADGGADTAAAAGIRPAAVIGDLDSISAAARRSAERLVPVEEQSSTDFEKCLQRVRAPCCLGLGFVGARLDHTLASLHALARWPLGARVVLVSEHDALCVPRGPLQLALTAGDRLSVCPLGPLRFVRSRGLAWPLDALEMAIGAAIGSSNRVLDGPVTIEPDPARPGPWALIVPAARADALLDALRAAAPR